MENLSKLFLERAENELLLVETLFNISQNKKLKQELKIGDETFYSQAISHSYYCIFYSAKAYLTSKGIKTSSPNEHLKVYFKFKEFVKSGEIDEKLGLIYEDLMIKAENLLDIFLTEKSKRGKYTYFKLPQANKSPASQSINNAKLFFKIINSFLEDFE